jgi:hypothetical protein
MTITITERFAEFAHGKLEAGGDILKWLALPGYQRLQRSMMRRAPMRVFPTFN